MPNAKFHIITGFIIGIITYSLVFYLLKISLKIIAIESILIIPIVWTYSLLPDIDHPNSTIRKWFNLLTIGILCFLVYYKVWLIGASILVLFLLVTFKLKHRKEGQTHSILYSLIFALPLLAFNPLIAFVGFNVYNSHLILDKIIRGKR